MLLRFDIKFSNKENLKTFKMKGNITAEVTHS